MEDGSAEIETKRRESVQGYLETTARRYMTMARKFWKSCRSTRQRR
jgi:hypothetical protein